MMKDIWRNLIKDIKCPRIVTIIGGGGKTSLMYYLVRVLKEQGEQVIGTATTKLSSQARSGHSFIRARSLSVAHQIVKMVKERAEYTTLVYGEVEGSPEKMMGIPQEWVEELATQNPETLFVVEGDGSVGKSLKGHLPSEPVIPSRSSLVIAVIGIDAVGAQISSQYVHRPERICELLKVEPKSLSTIEMITKLLFHPQGYFHNCSSHQVIVPFINKVESASQQQQAEELAHQILAVKHPQVGGVIVGSMRKEEGLWLQA